MTYLFYIIVLSVDLSPYEYFVITFAISDIDVQLQLHAFVNISFGLTYN